MMVVHVVPALGTAFIVSFPRDTEVDIPGHGHDKLNAAFAFGGPALTIQDVPGGVRDPDPALPRGRLPRLREDRRRDRPREDLLPDTGARHLYRAVRAHRGLQVARRCRCARVRDHGTTRSRSRAWPIPIRSARSRTGTRIPAPTSIASSASSTSCARSGRPRSTTGPQPQHRDPPAWRGRVEPPGRREPHEPRAEIARAIDARARSRPGGDDDAAGEERVRQPSAARAVSRGRTRAQPVEEPLACP